MKNASRSESTKLKCLSFHNDFVNEAHAINALQHNATAATTASVTLTASVSFLCCEKGKSFNYVWNFNKMLYILKAVCKYVTYFIMIYINT